MGVRAEPEGRGSNDLFNGMREWVTDISLRKNRKPLRIGLKPMIIGTGKKPIIGTGKKVIIVTGNRFLPVTCTLSYNYSTYPFTGKLSEDNCTVNTGHE